MQVLHLPRQTKSSADLTQRRSRPRHADPVNASPPIPGKPEFLFVDNVRFWSMAAIVAVHSLQAWGMVEWKSSRELQASLIQLCKFGTIGFYFISGFLLGERLEQGSARSYFFRRVRSTAGPWAVWAFILTVLLFAQSLRLGGHASGLLGTASSLGTSLCSVLFVSTYWFVPNFLFSLCILLLCRRFLHDWRLGGALLLGSVFYGVNVHEHWVATSHTTALFGFVFYQWLGVWVSAHSELVFSWVARLKANVVVGIALMTGAFALAEAAQLFRTSPGQDAFNTLRLSNQLYSLAVVLGLLKLGRITSPRFVNVRSDTFGVYLIHGIALFVLSGLVQVVARVAFGLSYRVVVDPHASAWRHPVMCLLIWGAMFAMVYGSSLALTTYLLRQPKYRWIVGQQERKSASLLSTTVATPPTAVKATLA